MQLLFVHYSSVPVADKKNVTEKGELQPKWARCDSLKIINYRISIFILSLSLLLLGSCRLVPRWHFRTKTNQTRNADPTCFITQMMNGDTLFVDYKSQGCFHYREDYLFINKVNDSLFCSFYKEITRDSWALRKDQLIPGTILSKYCYFQSKVQSYRKGKRYGCTTTSKIKIILHEHSIEVTHDDCGSNEWYDFKEALNEL